MQDKTMTANARKILLLTASAFCLSSAGAYLAAETFKSGNERRTTERTQQRGDNDGRASTSVALGR